MTKLAQSNIQKTAIYS